MAALRRAAYRVRQFWHAIRSYQAGLGLDQQAALSGALPERARRLFDSMPLPDRHHGLRVLLALRAQGLDDRALAQAALLHDAAKHRGGVTLLHRVAVVLIKAFRPALWKAWTAQAQAPRSAFWRPFWAHAHHPELSARLAADAGCDPLAVALIEHHQDGVALDARESELLRALRAADDDN